MFRLALSHKVVWPVTICKPIDDGKVQKHKIEVEFEIIPTDEYERVAKAGDFLARVLTGIESPILPEEGETPLDFESAKRSLLQVPYARAALVEAYFTASSGREAQQKN